MTEQEFQKLMADTMKRMERQFIDRGFAIMHIENSTTGTSEFMLNQKGQKLADFVREFFNTSNASEIEMPECVAFVHLLINGTRPSDGSQRAGSAI